MPKDFLNKNAGEIYEMGLVNQNILDQGETVSLIKSEHELMLKKTEDKQKKSNLLLMN